MRLSCQQDDLQRALAHVSRAVAKKSTLPVLGNILFSADGGRLRLAATNLDIGVVAWIDGQIEEPGTVTLPADLLSDFVASLPKEQVNLTLERKTLQVAIECGRSKAHVKGTPAEDFPTIATIGESDPTARIAPEVLKEMVAQVAFAAATDDSRPVLAGVLVEFEGNAVTMAAADGFRLSVRRAELESVVRESAGVVVPARALNELARVVGDQEGPIDLFVTANRSQLLARAGSVEFMSRLIDGNFPDVRQIIPKQYETRVVVPREAFLAAARRAKLFAQSSNDVVKIQLKPGDSELDPGYATISAHAAETGDNEDYLDARVSGPESQIAFNGRYLTDVLSVMKTGEVALEMSSPNAAGVLRPVESDDFTHVIMPMVIGSHGH